MRMLWYLDEDGQQLAGRPNQGVVTKARPGLGVVERGGGRGSREGGRGRRRGRIHT